MSAYFNGSTGYIQKADLFPSFAYPFTLSCWFNPDTQTSGTERTLIGLHDITRLNVDRNSLILSISTTGALRARASDFTSSNQSDTTDLVKEAEWNHGAGVFASATSRTAWLNGTAATTNTTSRTPTSNNYLTIGHSIQNTNVRLRYFTGGMAHVAIWDETLSSGEIIALSKGVNPNLIRPNALRYYLSLVEPPRATGTTVSDYAWERYNQAKRRFVNGEDPGLSTFANVRRIPNNPLVSPIFVQNTTIISAPAASQNNAPIFYHQRQQQGMAA